MTELALVVKVHNRPLAHCGNRVAIIRLPTGEPIHTPTHYEEHTEEASTFYSARMRGTTGENEVRYIRSLASLRSITARLVKVKRQKVH